MTLFFEEICRRFCHLCSRLLFSWHHVNTFLLFSSVKISCACVDILFAVPFPCADLVYLVCVYDVNCCCAFASLPDPIAAPVLPVNK